MKQDFVDITVSLSAWESERLSSKASEENVSLEDLASFFIYKAVHARLSDSGKRDSFFKEKAVHA